MTPTDHRLDHVSARLVERLEGSRRAWRSPEEIARESARIADEQLDGVTGELREVMPGPEAEHHAAFLRTEVHRTILPRYLDLARRFNDVERRNFGFGPLGDPIGRVAVALLALVFAGVFLLRFLWEPAIWPLVPVVFSAPLWPDLVAWIWRRRLARDLQALVDDAARIQDQAQAYVPMSAAELDPHVDRAREAARRAASARNPE